MSKIVISLDTDINLAKKIVKKSLKYNFDIFKIGHIIFNISPEFINYVINHGGKVLLDLKYHDIPTVISKAVCLLLEKYDIWGFTIHLSGGEKMVKSVVNTARNVSSKTKIFGVTVLTSLDNNDIKKIGLKTNVENLVINLANLGKRCGTDGVVCSFYEVRKIKSLFGKKFLTLVPGVSIKDEGSGMDQQRKVLLKDAILSPADYIVIGRSVYMSEDLDITLDTINKILNS